MFGKLVLHTMVEEGVMEGGDRKGNVPSGPHWLAVQSAFQIHKGVSVSYYHSFPIT